jgi:hypothetical protein
MDYIQRMVGYMDRTDTYLQKAAKDGKQHTSTYKIKENCKNNIKKQYDRIMYRKTVWQPFGQESKNEEHDECTIVGDEVFMEMVKNDNSLTSYNKKPEYYKYYKDMNISDKLIEQNHKTWTEHKNKYKTVRETYTDSRGLTYMIAVTRPVEKVKYNPKYMVPNAGGVRPSRSLDDLVADKLNNGDDRNMTMNNPNDGGSKSYKYVPPSIRNGETANVNEDNRKLIIRNIPKDFMEDDVARVIMKCGKLHDVRIHRDKYTGESKGFAFVKCESSETARKIIKTYNRFAMGNMIIHINYAEDRKDHKR